MRLARVIGWWSRPGSQNIHNSFFTLLRAVAFWRCLEFRIDVTREVKKSKSQQSQNLSQTKNGFRALQKTFKMSNCRARSYSLNYELSPKLKVTKLLNNTLSNCRDAQNFKSCEVTK